MRVQIQVRRTGGICQPARITIKILGDEDQDHRNDERQQAEKLGSCEADEQAALLAVCGARVAQCALEERTEHVTHTGCCRDRRRWLRGLHR